MRVPVLWKCLGTHFPCCSGPSPSVLHPTGHQGLRSAKSSLLRGQMHFFLFLPLSFLFVFSPRRLPLFSGMTVCSLVHLKEHYFFFNFSLLKTSNTCERTVTPPHTHTHNIPKTQRAPIVSFIPTRLPPHSFEVDRRYHVISAFHSVAKR